MARILRRLRRSMARRRVSEPFSMIVIVILTAQKAVGLGFSASAAVGLVSYELPCGVRKKLGKARRLSCFMTSAKSQMSFCVSKAKFFECYPKSVLCPLLRVRRIHWPLNQRERVCFSGKGVCTFILFFDQTLRSPILTPGISRTAGLFFQLPTGRVRPWRLPLLFCFLFLLCIIQSNNGVYQ